MNTDIYSDDGVFGGGIFGEEFDFTHDDSASKTDRKNAWVVWIPAAVAKTAVIAAATAVVAFGPVRSSTYERSDERIVISAVQRARFEKRLASMTEQMKTRAAAARMHFVRSAHPGLDDPDPDYGL